VLMRPSEPVLHFCPRRNQTWRCKRFRSVLVLLLLGTEILRTPRLRNAFSVWQE
jgi:hypothetical protein